MIKFLYLRKEVIIFCLSFISLVVSFFFNEDGTGGGARGDFEVTYGFILALQENLLSNPTDWTLVHTPLHFIILSLVTRFVENSDTLRFLFCLFSLSIPLLFYLILSRFNGKEFSKKNLLIISSCIFFIPSYRYTSIWGNDLITSLFFFLLSVYFFKKWELNKSKNLGKNLLLQIFFLVLATYTRQYFAIFFGYFLYKYYQALYFKNFIKLFGICIISSIPVFFYVYKFPELLTGQHISIYAVSYFILGNSSIMSITLYPLVAINFLYKTIPFKKIIAPCLLSFLIVFILSLNFNPTNWQGGGVNFAISQKLLHNNLYFYFSSFFTMSVFIYLILNNKNNIIIISILLFMFFSYQVYQRYYDPMFFIILFLIIDTNLKNILYKYKKCSFLLLVYFLLYYLASISDFIYKL